MIEEILRKLLAASFAAVLLCLSADDAARAQVNVTTYHYDNYRTGWNQNETALKQSNVGSGTFGLLRTTTVDDQVDAQPLVVSNETINGSQHNVVYVATESNSIYAIDASSGQVLLHTNLGTPVYYTNLPGSCNANGPNVGINSTPVIDPTGGVLYVIAYTWENNAAVYRIHALSLKTFADVVPPVVISASGRLSNGRTYQFNARVSRQRAALLLANNTVYAGFASWCDTAANQSRGWVLAWQAGTLMPLASNKLTNAQPHSKNNYFLTSVWMSGYGLAANAGGSVYFVTGNSDYSGKAYNEVTNIAESAVEMSADLSTLQGLFTPGNHAKLDKEDGDFGSGGLMLLPAQDGKHPEIAAAAGKDGKLYPLVAEGLSGIPNPRACPAGPCIGSYQIGGCWCGPSYYQGSDGAGRIVTSGGLSIEVWTLKKDLQLARENTWCCIADGQYDGFFTSVSSNGKNAGTAIVWAVGRPTDSDPAYVDLYAVNADSGQSLFTEIAGQWPNTGGDANIVPVIANGLVYVASDQTLAIFGPGGTRKPALPRIRHVDMRVPLAPGEHEIYGTVESINAATIVIRRRGGEQLRLDATDARRNWRVAEPAVGHALIARGTFNKANVLQANIILHAMNHPAVWPADR